jgi:two-component system response regulator DegU
MRRRFPLVSTSSDVLWTVDFTPTIAIAVMGQANEPTLTNRELDVLRLLGDGKTNNEIAQTLGVRPRTVAFHVESLLTKLEVNNRAQAAVKAIKYGWIETKAD